MNDRDSFELLSVTKYLKNAVKLEKECTQGLKANLH